jgi:hypothetical protein
MNYDPYDPQLQLTPVASDTEMSSSMSRGRRWFNQVVMQCSHPMLRSKPDWVHLPDRVWRRQSALLVSLHERDRDA